jgi:hypothetical protein
MFSKFECKIHYRNLGKELILNMIYSITTTRDGR